MVYIDIAIALVLLRMDVQGKRHEPMLPGSLSTWLGFAAGGCWGGHEGAMAATRFVGPVVPRGWKDEGGETVGFLLFFPILSNFCIGKWSFKYFQGVMFYLYLLDGEGSWGHPLLASAPWPQEAYLFGFDLPCYRVNTFQDGRLKQHLHFCDFFWARRRRSEEQWKTRRTGDNGLEMTW
jgi:hypothetical protein